VEFSVVEGEQKKTTVGAGVTASYSSLSLSLSFTNIRMAKYHTMQISESSSGNTPRSSSENTYFCLISCCIFVCNSYGRDMQQICCICVCNSCNSYGMATIRRLLKITGLFLQNIVSCIGLFCKRNLSF